MRVDTQPDEWRLQEDWALLENAEDFSVTTHFETVTFWDSLICSTPELCQRTSSECFARMSKLVSESGKRIPYGKPAPVLQKWERLEDGRYTGTCDRDGRQYWLNPSLEGSLGRVNVNYVESLSGHVYGLGTSSAVAPASSAEHPAQTTTTLPSPAAAALLSSAAQRLQQHGQTGLTTLAVLLIAKHIVVPIAVGSHAGRSIAGRSALEYGCFGQPLVAASSSAQQQPSTAAITYLHVSKHHQPRSLGEQRVIQQRVVALTREQLRSVEGMREGDASSARPSSREPWPSAGSGDDATGLSTPWLAEQYAGAPDAGPPRAADGHSERIESLVHAPLRVRLAVEEARLTEITRAMAARGTAAPPLPMQHVFPERGAVAQSLAEWGI